MISDHLVGPPTGLRAKVTVAVLFFKSLDMKYYKGVEVKGDVPTTSSLTS